MLRVDIPTTSDAHLIEKIDEVRYLKFTATAGSQRFRTRCMWPPMYGCSF